LRNISWLTALLLPQVDERLLAQALVKQHLGRVLAVGQLLVVDWRGVSIVARVTATDTLDAAAQEVGMRR